MKPNVDAKKDSLDLMGNAYRTMSAYKMVMVTFSIVAYKAKTFLINFQINVEMQNQTRCFIQLVYHAPQLALAKNLTYVLLFAVQVVDVNKDMSLIEIQDGVCFPMNVPRPRTCT